MPTRLLKLLYVVLALGLVGASAFPAGAVSVSTTDGMTLTLNSNGTWNSMTVDGNTVPQLAGVTGGFIVAMRDGMIVPWPRTTFYAGTAVSGTATQNGSDINFTGSASGINFNITLQGGLPYIKVHGTASNNSDHSFSLYFRIPVDANGWKWWNHVNGSQTIATDPANWYFASYHFHQARHPDLSVNPFGAITKTSSPTMGLSLSPLMYPPQAYAIQYNSQGGFWIEIELAVTSRTSKHPNSADFDFVIYKHDPNWGDRSAVARYYSFFPQWFTRISEGGNWMVNYGNYPTNPQDFAIKYFETNNFESSWEASNDIYNCKYNEAWCYHWGSTDNSYLEQRAQDVSANWTKECIGKGQTYCEAAQSIILSGMRHYDGVNVGPDDPSRWEDGDWGCGITWRYITNPDVEVPNWRGFTLQGGTPRNRGQSDKYWEWYTSWGNWPTGDQHFGGLYHDSTGGGWCGWGSVHNFHPNHWGTYDFACVPNGDSRDPAGAVAMWSTFHFVEFAKYAHDQMLTEDRPVMDNGDPGFEMYALAPWIDFFGVGEYYDGNIQNLSIARMLANQRGCSYLYGGQSQSTILRTLLMGVYPGFGGGENYESYRSLYSWLMPIFNALDEAGWQPVTAARTSNTSFYVERYGPASDGTIYVAIQPTTTGSTTITVNSAELGWPANPDVTVTELVYGGGFSTGYSSGNLTITTNSIPANETRVYRIVPNWSVGTQVSVYPDAWESYANAPSTITSGSLTSVQADDANYMVVACDPVSHKFSSHYTWHSGYAPANVTRLTLTFKGKNSRSDTPNYLSWIKQQSSGTWTSIRGGGTWGTTDETMTWTTTSTSAYMTAEGMMEINFCGCPVTADNYSFSANWVKMDLWVLNTAPVANFTGTPTSGSAPLAVSFTDTSTGGPTSWSWTFGDGGTSTAQSPSHSYNSAASYTVSLTATNASGSDGETKTNYIMVTQPAPVANFTGNPTSGVAPLAVAFTDTSTNSPTSWSWSFGDSTTSTAQNPSHTYTAAASYTVTLTATNAGGSDGETKTNYITVTQPAPVANFTGNPTSGAAPLAVAFTDTSTNSPTSWSWNFGDSTTSTAQNPSHSYTAAASYTVTLTATNAGGSDGETKNNYITVTAPAPVANFSGTPVNGSVPMAVSFTDSSTNSPTSWSWTFGDSGTSTSQNPSHTYTTAGDYTVSLTATNSGGSDSETKTNYITAAAANEVVVYPDTWGADRSNTLLSGGLTDLRTNDDSYMVVRSDTSNQQYAVWYTADTSYTPSQISKITIQHIAKSSSSTSPMSWSVVWARNSSGSWVNLGGWFPGTSETSYSWETTAVSTYMNASGVVGFRFCGCPGDANNYNISSELMRFRLQLGNPPVANFSGSPTSGLKTLAVAFTDSSTNSPTSWSWNFGDSTTSTAQNPSHSYTNQGLYTVTLTATNAGGSDGETKTNYIRVFREVSAYPTSWNSYDNALSTLISGGLSNLQADDASYMRVRSNASNYKYSVHYVFGTSYTPSHVGKITFDYNGKNSRSNTPNFLCFIKKQSDSTWTQAYYGLWTTTDKSISWNTTDTNYISSGGQLEVNFCGCPAASQTYDQYADLVRMKLWLDN